PAPAVLAGMLRIFAASSAVSFGNAFKYRFSRSSWSVHCRQCVQRSNLRTDRQGRCVAAGTARLTMTGRLAGKVAVVTGAAPRGEGVGNGMATAIAFAREGAKVVLVNRDALRAEKLAAMIVKDGGTASVFAGDVTKPEVAEAMAAFATRHYGRLDVLHNNVGIAGPGNPETIDMDNWNRILQTNLTSAMLCAKYCIPKMRDTGGGSIINISSIAGAIGLSGSKG